MKPDLNKFAEVSIENLEHLLTEKNHPEYVAYLNYLAENGSFEAAEKLDQRPQSSCAATCQRGNASTTSMGRTTARIPAESSEDAAAVGSA